jgi:hypothetical protein
MTVKKAETVIADLEAKRAACVKRGTELADERAAVALDAHTGNTKARKRLDEINAAIATHESELASLGAAIKAAGESLKKAEAAAALEADRKLAGEARIVVDRIDELFASADTHFKQAFEALKAADTRIEELRQLGFAFPTALQVRMNARFAFMTYLLALPKYWWNELQYAGVQYPSPAERRTFSQFWQQMSAALGREIAQRLGEAKQKEVA